MALLVLTSNDEFADLVVDARRSREEPDAADASARGTASKLVLAMYGRIPVGTLKLDGDRRVFDQLVAWDPGA